MFCCYLGHSSAYTLFQTEKHIFTKSHIHILFAFVIKNPPKNRNTVNQPIHFSMTPKCEFYKKEIFEIFNLKKSVCLKKQRLNLKQKIKPYFHNINFLTIF